jgi:threonine/homoserine/homoserine lactone efflux protein
MRLLAVCAIALVFGFVGSMPLAGPIALLVVSRAAQKRFGEAIRIACGAAAAEAAYAGAAFFGYTELIARRATVLPISRGATAVVLIVLGVRFVRFSPTHARDTRENKAGTVLFGFTVSALNPTLILTWSVAVAFVYSYGLDRISSAYALPFGLCAGAGIAAWFSLLVSLLRRYEEKIAEPVLTWTVRAMGLALLVLGASSVVTFVHWIRS